jgi:hypothetical protein
VTVLWERCGAQHRFRRIDEFNAWDASAARSLSRSPKTGVRGRRFESCHPDQYISTGNGLAPARSFQFRHTLGTLIVWSQPLGSGTETEKELEALIDAGEFARRYLSEDAADAALVDRSKMIDEGVGRFREAARPR